MDNPVIVLDNGASTIKVGIANGQFQNPRLIPNAVIRSKGDKTVYIGHEFENCKDYSSLHYRLPFEKGYLVDWDAQKAVWDGIFSDQVLGINTTESTIVVTEPYFNLPNIQDVYDQFIFEEYEFQSYYRCTPASNIPFGSLFAQPGVPPAECIIVVDSGFSFTHVVPLLGGKIVWNAVKRLDVGGKLLTNHLKELVSFRQWNMMDETFIMNDAKESCCYVSSDFKRDLETCRRNLRKNDIVQEYILPDFSVNRRGRIRQGDDIVAETDQLLVMNNERFTVPEILFRPDDIGMDQMGLAGTIALSISLLPQNLQGMFWANIGLIGGNSKFPGFKERLMSELRTLAPVEHEVIIYQCDDPVTEAYRSAFNFAGSPSTLKPLLVTRAEYAEGGSNASRKKFMDWKHPKSHGAALYESIMAEPEVEVSEKEKEKETQRQPRPPPQRVSGTRGLRRR